jgi:hypothetical protein
VKSVGVCPRVQDSFLVVRIVVGYDRDPDVSRVIASDHQLLRRSAQAHHERQAADVRPDVRYRAGLPIQGISMSRHGSCLSEGTGKECRRPRVRAHSGRAVAAVIATAMPARELRTRLRIFL